MGGAGILCGLVLFTLGLVRLHVRCDRDDGVCIIRASPLSPAETLRLDEIREHKFWLRRGPLGQHAETILIDRAGRRISIAEGRYRDARSRYEAFEAFYDGRTDEVELTADAAWDWIIAGVLVFLFAGVWWREKRAELAGRKPRHIWRA